MKPPALPAPAPVPLCFGEFVLDVLNARLHRRGEVVELAPKSFALLAYLAQRPGELVLKDSLLDVVWNRRFVSEGAIKTVVSELRAALGDDARAPRWIETVQRRGYRFLGEVGPATVAAPAAAARPAPGTGHAAEGNLPANLPLLIARDAECAALAVLLDTRRLVTLTGTAGVGKTRLAMGLASTQRSRFEHGVWLVQLAPLSAESTDEATLRATLARELQLAPGAAASASALSRALAPLSLLLVLDNAEHLLAPLAPLLAHLIAELPGLHLLITSREPVQIPGEQVYRLLPLAVPAAGVDDDAARLMDCGSVQLFVERVAARLPGFALAAPHLQAVAALCRALDGLPLALELAAARVPVLGVNGLAERLTGTSEPGSRLQLLTQGTRTAAPHQRTLRAALDWSHALLTPAQQRVFRRLAVFRGGFTLDAAQAVCADEALDAWGVLDALDALIEKSMLTGPAAGATGGRFSQLESLHEYAHELWLSAGEEAATRRRHLQAARAYWAQADALSLEVPALAWVEAHGPEIDNLRSALRWGQAAGDAAVVDDWLALVGHSGALWHRAGLAAEGAAWCAAADAVAPQQADARLRAGIDLAWATLSCYSTVLPAPEGLARASSAATGFECIGDAVREYYAHCLACLLLQQGQQRGERAAHLARIEALLQPGWGPMLRRFWRGIRAYELRLGGDHGAYLAYARTELALCRQAGAQWEAWVAAHALALAEDDSGRPEAALALCRDTVAEIRAAGRLRQNATRVVLWVTMQAQSGDAPGTRSALAEALPVVSGAGMLGMLPLSLAWLAHYEGRHRGAAALLGWFDAPQRAGAVYGPGTYIRRSIDALGGTLAKRLGARTLAGMRARGDALGDDAAVSLGLDTVDLAP
jgi:predicted ATPase/DNA-binding winged helix-turn-helix (wHTH) protein